MIGEAVEGTVLAAPDPVELAPAALPVRLAELPVGVRPEVIPGTTPGVDATEVGAPLADPVCEDDAAAELDPELGARPELEPELGAPLADPAGEDEAPALGPVLDTPLADPLGGEAGAPVLTAELGWLVAEERELRVALEALAGLPDGGLPEGTTPGVNPGATPGVEVADWAAMLEPVADEGPVAAAEAVADPLLEEGQVLAAEERAELATEELARDDNVGPLMLEPLGLPEGAMPGVMPGTTPGVEGPAGDAALEGVLDKPAEIDAERVWLALDGMPLLPAGGPLDIALDAGSDDPERLEPTEVALAGTPGVNDGTMPGVDPEAPLAAEALLAAVRAVLLAAELLCEA